jgi:hypothetical protein
MQENDHIIVTFPLGTPQEEVERIMIERAKEYAHIAIDEQASLATLKNRRNTVFSDTWQMLIKGMGVL